MTDKECIEELEFWLADLNNRIIKLGGFAYAPGKLQEARTHYALARAALITLRNEVEKDKSE